MLLESERLEMSKDMKRFFDDEKNLRTALEIAEHVDRIRETTIEQFLGHLKYALDKRLSEAGVDDTWEVYLNENEDEGGGLDNDLEEVWQATFRSLRPNL